MNKASQLCTSEQYAHKVERLAVTYLFDWVEHRQTNWARLLWPRSPQALGRRLEKRDW